MPKKKWREHVYVRGCVGSSCELSGGGRFCSWRGGSSIRLGILREREVRNERDVGNVVNSLIIGGIALRIWM